MCVCTDVLKIEYLWTAILQNSPLLLYIIIVQWLWILQKSIFFRMCIGMRIWVCVHVCRATYSYMYAGVWGRGTDKSGTLSRQWYFYSDIIFPMLIILFSSNQFFTELEKYFLIVCPLKVTLLALSTTWRLNCTFIVADNDQLQGTEETLYASALNVMAVTQCSFNTFNIRLGKSAGLCYQTCYIGYKMPYILRKRRKNEIGGKMKTIK
jgi:hypothetical protein